ncbi:Sun tRNA and rRNA cytosine-C5-methylases [Comamonadaceae bacterium]
MTLRVNLRKVTSAQYALSLQTAGIEVSNAYGSCIELAKPVAVTQLPGFQEGWVSVQDGAAQVAATLLLESATPQERPRILDACAAPGGKTAHLLELVEADVLALEIDPTRAQRIEQTLNRLGLTATVLCADAAEPPTWWDGRPFDYILLDAPCTASGIVRRHPDIRWLRRPTDVAQLAAEQRRILKGLWPLVKEGGRLLYCTCSIFRAEGDEQVKAFLDNNKDARLLQSPGHLIPAAVPTPSVMADNQIGDHDGFFYALFEKTRV